MLTIIVVSSRGQTEVKIKMRSISELFPKTISRGRFALISVIIAVIVFAIGVYVAEDRVQINLKPLFLLAISVHYFVMRARAADYSPKKGVAHYYSIAVCGLAFIAILSSLRGFSAPLYGYNFALLGYYMVFLFLALPVLIGGSLRKPKAEKQIDHAD